MPSELEDVGVLMVVASMLEDTWSVQQLWQMRLTTPDVQLLRRAQDEAQ